MEDAIVAGLRRVRELEAEVRALQARVAQLEEEALQFKAKIAALEEALEGEKAKKAAAHRRVLRLAARIPVVVYSRRVARKRCVPDLLQQRAALEAANRALSERVDELENAPTSGLDELVDLYKVHATPPLPAAAALLEDQAQALKRFNGNGGAEFPASAVIERLAALLIDAGVVKPDRGTSLSEDAPSASKRGRRRRRQGEGGAGSGDDDGTAASSGRGEDGDDDGDGGFDTYGDDDDVYSDVGGALEGEEGGAPRRRRQKRRQKARDTAGDGDAAHGGGGGRPGGRGKAVAKSGAAPREPPSKGKVWCWNCGAGPYRNVGPCPKCRCVLYYGISIAEEKKKLFVEEYDRALKKWAAESRREAQAEEAERLGKLRAEAERHEQEELALRAHIDVQKRAKAELFAVHKQLMARTQIAYPQPPRHPTKPLTAPSGAARQHQTFRGVLVAQPTPTTTAAAATFEQCVLAAGAPPLPREEGEAPAPACTSTPIRLVEPAPHLGELFDVANAAPGELPGLWGAGAASRKQTPHTTVDSGPPADPHRRISAILPLPPAPGTHTRTHGIEDIDGGSEDGDALAIGGGQLTITQGPPPPATAPTGAGRVYRMAHGEASRPASPQRPRWQSSGVDPRDVKRSRPPRAARARPATRGVDSSALAHAGAKLIVAGKPPGDDVDGAVGPFTVLPNPKRGKAECVSFADYIRHKVQGKGGKERAATALPSMIDP
eukprot:TRINITY_DN7610_c0_g1_i1.p1 TRINITY_DN7610_c0_g1~~TRINITY_DN7610_c0_g1_i1.p1  ORF type:complete len:730 (+),score=245.43 TRINITY_DN7610_c0_g1_i1:27-2192(+)